MKWGWMAFSWSAEALELIFSTDLSLMAVRCGEESDADGCRLLRSRCIIASWQCVFSFSLLSSHFDATKIGQHHNTILEIIPRISIAHYYFERSCAVKFWLSSARHHQERFSCIRKRQLHLFAQSFASILIFPQQAFLCTRPSPMPILLKRRHWKRS